jgi:hypothetical protein
MNGMNWRDFVDAIREAGEPSQLTSKAQQRYKRQRKKNDIYTSGGGHKEPDTGSPYVKKAKRFGTDSLRFEEDVGPESFEVHETLESRIWEDEEVKEPIREKLIKIATHFMDRLPVDVEIRDIVLTGSLANYNWSNYSDVDLHIIIDFLDVDENKTLVKALFDNARMKWNDKHNIKMKGYDVEIYVEDSGEKHHSGGVYSLMNNEWVNRPTKYRRNIDFTSARRKADDIGFQVNIVDNLITARKFKAAMRNVLRLKEKIKNMRRAGLESAQREFSVENIAFKILRRNGILDQLENQKNKIYDDMMSVLEH